MTKWVQIAEELEARLAAAKNHGPNAIAPAALQNFAGPVIEARARQPEPRPALPAPEQPKPGVAVPGSDARFATNGRLLDSAESFLKVGRKGKW
jgi:hypothetical protein